MSSVGALMKADKPFKARKMRAEHVPYLTLFCSKRGIIRLLGDLT